ncbi:GNAT family N-acetyltransferase [Pontibacter sp. SGAir0037]|uniref:GNAT family N-acetyltransferase n=1 Tax=Pontibacter sp. SGAir0037 TaxID=2571030 RepID=UPI0010CD4F16|nr:GNAT family N-acetyltransferase [Pontibacter sp. SGAir0037]QCR21375.1 GNAT family N-acetyltransferase [Pontibacter sp. SGAir0037]
MTRLVRTNSEDAAFRELVLQLDKELKERDGDDHTFYAQFNKIDMIRHAVVAFEQEQPVGCGAFKQFEGSTAEVKRMFVHPSVRNQGIASKVLKELEAWAKEVGFTDLVLETGKAQPEAINLYFKSGYRQITNYGQYAGVDNSICMQKSLTEVSQSEV